MKYDPLTGPDSEWWLGLEEQEKLALILEQHELSGVEIPGIRLHAAIHTVVENQLAMGIPDVQETLDRLVADGLDRHEALHAIGRVLADLIYDTIHQHWDWKNLDPMPEGYFRELRELTVEKWREMG
ncbi:MAG TPA: DUF1841 domain-containing protein [Planctomycetes bacterium]|nr:DUF1841 domain-containing protein [Planctomycetota bacterium]